MKKLPIEQRKVSTTFALSLKALEKLDEIQALRYPGRSRSYALEEIISAIYKMWVFDDLVERLEKQKLSSVYGEVHNAEQTDKV